MLLRGVCYLCARASYARALRRAPRHMVPSSFQQLAPSILILFIRAAGQLQLSHPSEFGPQHTLQSHSVLIGMFNANSIWNHAYVGASDVQTAVLDSVGMGMSHYVLFSHPRKFTCPVSPTDPQD